MLNENCNPGDTFALGTHDGKPLQWRVLDVRDGRALLLSEVILERKQYHDKLEPVAWDTCSLRQYLNGEFYKSFSEADRARIALTRNENPDNTWGRTQGEPFGTPGGNPTDDHIFLPSVADVLSYFPGLKPHKDSYGDEWWYEADEQLMAKLNGNGFWWWLRSPGAFQYLAARVLTDGYVYLHGRYVSREGGVRPALWVKLEGGQQR